MKPTIIAATIAALLALGFFTASGQAPAQPRGVLSILHVGQPVTVKDAPGRYEISVIENIAGPLGHKVIEVGADYLVVEDIAGVSETRIPIWSIKSVVAIKVGTPK